jgi:hypothetical protein
VVTINCPIESPVPHSEGALIPNCRQGKRRPTASPGWEGPKVISERLSDAYASIENGRKGVSRLV